MHFDFNCTAGVATVPFSERSVQVMRSVLSTGRVANSFQQRAQEAPGLN